MNLNVYGINLPGCAWHDVAANARIKENPRTVVHSKLVVERRMVNSTG